MSFDQRKTDKYNLEQLEINLNKHKHEIKKATLISYNEHEEEKEHSSPHKKISEGKNHLKSPVIGYAGPDTLNSLAVYENN
jgi:hypothetical protein